MTAYSCIGGPLHGKKVMYEEARKQGYIAFNCSNRYNRTKIAYKRAAARNEIIPPSMVWIHQGCFEGEQNENI